MDRGIRYLLGAAVCALIIAACGGGGGSDDAGGIVAGPSASSFLNDTGIVLYGFNGSGERVACEFAIAGNDCNTGRDAGSSVNDAGDGKAGFSFTKLDAGGNEMAADASGWRCVRDNVTGLVWENKTDDGGLHDKGKTYTNFLSASQSAGFGAPDDAAGFISVVKEEGLCGKSDWRLPAADELLGIVDFGAQNGTAVDAGWFANTVSAGYWTSSRTTGFDDFAWMVGFDSGYVGGGSLRSMPAAVRLVQGAAPSGSLTVLAGGQEVADSRTGLVWRRCAEGLAWTGSTCTGSAATFTHAEALQHAATEAANAGKAWRLPNIKELNSIADRSRSGIAIDPARFPATPASYFWSSSHESGDSGKAWELGFEEGHVGTYSRFEADNHVRLVREAE